jgi:hypothetical protein
VASPSEPEATGGAWAPERYFEALARMRESGGAEATRALIACEEDYLASVPALTLARCPFTGAELVHSIETRGLDGPWWRYDNAVRPVEDPPPTFFALTGAVKLAPDVEWFPFLCKPGPEVPFVVPRLLEHEAVRAVISQLAIGAHQGFAITYFADPVPEGLARFNDWGSDHYETLDGWASTFEDAEPLDFDLGPWISSSKLSWVAPGDLEFRLRTELDSCPYLGLLGRPSFLRIQAGDVWTPPPAAGTAPSPARVQPWVRPKPASGEDPFDPR